MRTSLALVACAVLLAGARHDAEAGGGSVTLQLDTYKNANGVRVLVFSGAVANPEPGQDVEIVAEDCGVRGNRLFSATKTVGGGAFHVENPTGAPTYASTPWSSGITFRARWNGRLSEPMEVRLPAPLYAVKVRARTWKVYFNPQDSRTRAAGKVVELQRFTGGTLGAVPDGTPEAQAEPPAGRLQPRGSVHGAGAGPPAQGLPAGAKRRAVLGRRNVGTLALLTA